MAEAPNGEKQIGRAYGAPRQPSTLPAQDPPAMAHAIITRLMRVSKVVFFAICCASSASAWDRVGHLVVDAIAWELCLLFIHPRAPNLINLLSASTMLA